MKSELLCVDEAAEFLAVSETTVRVLCRAGRLPCLRIGRRPGSGAMRILRSDLMAFLEEARV